MRPSRIVLFLFVFPACLSCGDQPGGQNTNKPPSALRVQGYIASPAPFASEVNVAADLSANELVELKAPVSGQVLEIYFEEGQQVKQGAPIIRIDDRSWKAQLIGLQAEWQAATRELERMKSLLEIEGSSQEEVDNAQSLADRLGSQVEQIRLNIDLANVKAPFSGWLGLRRFSVGSYLREGDLITVLADLSRLKVDFSLAREYKSGVRPGATVGVIVMADTLEARVYAVSPVVSTSTRTIDVRALLEQDRSRLFMPGSYAEAVVSINFMADALLVPTQAIVPEIDKQTVYIYRNGKARRMPVVTGERTVDKIRVIEGIAAGDTVITTGLLQVKDGADVTLEMP